VTQADLLRAMRGFKGFKAVTSKKLVQEELSWHRTSYHTKPARAPDLLPGLDLDSYPENVQVPGDDDKFWRNYGYDPHEDEGSSH